MTSKNQCCLLSFDYLDYDVFLNVRTFYRLAGYEISANDNLSVFQLVIVLRGLPPRVFNEYFGPIHYYDYVREHSYDIYKYFPNASRIYHVTIESFDNNKSDYKYIYGYLPVIPSIWQFSLPSYRRNSTPIHISNYKPLENDLYQAQLIDLIKLGKIKVYGAKWDRIKISTIPLSYLSSNLRLSRSVTCYGLMYPYQRGKSLSGRMWQAPIQGCLVISEDNTNPFHCPGVIEVESFSNKPEGIKVDANQVAYEASQFWLNKTICLAKDLDLALEWRDLRFEIYYSRLLMLKQHIEFRWNLDIVLPISQALSATRKECVRFLRKLGM
jgi:hypothetical protein